jgi:hypothetical protein
VTRTPLWGLVAEFDGPEALREAALRVRLAGYRRIDAYTPFPLEGLDHALGFRPTWVPLLVLVGGIVGCVGGYFLQWYAMGISYPLNVGGRPLNSWPMFVPITFELTVLAAGLTAAFGMFALNGLPMPYHPLFNVPRFARASQDGFFLAVQASDPQFDRAGTAAFLRSLGAREVSEVAR